MKKLFLIAVSCAFVVGSKAQASAIYLQTTPSTYPGQSFNVYLAVSGIPNLAGFEFDLSYTQPSITGLGLATGGISALRVDEGNFLPYSRNSTYFYSGSINNATGMISSVSDLTASGTSAASGGTLATVVFQSVLSAFGQVPPSQILLTNYELIDGNGNLITPTTVNGTVTAGVLGPQTANDPPPIVPATINVGSGAPVVTPEPANLVLIGGLLLTLRSLFSYANRQAQSIRRNLQLRHD